MSQGPKGHQLPSGLFVQTRLWRLGMEQQLAYAKLEARVTMMGMSARRWRALCWQARRMSRRGVGGFLGNMEWLVDRALARGRL
jgi:hypothetical protein